MNRKADFETSTTFGDQIREKTTKIGDQVGTKTDSLIQHGQEFAEKIQKEAGEYSDAVVNYIRENPVKAALIAGGVGLLLAKLLIRH